MTGAEHFAYLMALPVHNPERANLRERVPHSPKRLATLAKRFATVTGWHAKPYDWNKTNPEPIVPAFARGTRQAPCLPFESGNNVLPGLERFITSLRKAA